MATRKKGTAAVKPGDYHVVASFCLGPCARTGKPSSDTDWWVEQHISCEGLAVLRPGLAVTCTCPCHTAPHSPEALERAANMRLATLQNGEERWRTIRQEGGSGPG